MSTKIENHKYNIDEAFRECFYIVPDYQREYVWSDKEVHQLLEDINDEISDIDKELLTVEFIRKIVLGKFQ